MNIFKKVLGVLLLVIGTLHIPKNYDHYDSLLDALRCLQRSYE